MADSGERPSNLLPLPRWTIIIHGVQILLAIIILGLDAYGIRWIAYNALIFSLVTALLTLGICAYIIFSTLVFNKIYNAFLVLGLHILMIIFWIVDLGLVANLARIWASPDCYYSYYSGYYCSYGKRDLSSVEKREDTTSVKTYYGALAAGAFFGAMQFALWVLSAILVVIYLNKHRSNLSAPTNNPPVYTGGEQGIPVEQKYGHSTQQEQQPLYQQPQQPYPVASPQPQYAQPVQQPVYNQPQQPVYDQTQQYPSAYAQNPISRDQTVSPVSQVGYAPPQSTSELDAPHHAGGYNPNASELSNQK